MTENTIKHTKIGKIIRDVTNISGSIDTAAANEKIRNGIHFRGANAWILAFSIVIASVGLNINSIAVIIGAMLISWARSSASAWDSGPMTPRSSRTP